MVWFLIVCWIIVVIIVIAIVIIILVQISKCSKLLILILIKIYQYTQIDQALYKDKEITTIAIEITVITVVIVNHPKTMNKTLITHPTDQYLHHHQPIKTITITVWTVLIASIISITWIAIIIILFILITIPIIIIIASTIIITMEAIKICDHQKLLLPFRIYRKLCHLAISIIVLVMTKAVMRLKMVVVYWNGQLINVSLNQ